MQISKKMKLLSKVKLNIENIFGCDKIKQNGGRIMDERIEQLRGKLIVSCQALPEEPLHSDYIMGRMALAAKQGGAHGIRANTKEDIKEIQAQVNLPIIGIVKRNYGSNEIYITPTMKEVDELMEVTPDIIALDATLGLRPDGKSLDEFFKDIKEKYPKQLLMADCSTLEEAVHADKLGFDFIGTTMVGYTKQSKGDKIEANDFEILRNIVANVEHRVIAEGNIDTPEKAKRVIELGAFSVVVGSIITRPQIITKHFAEALK
jgi:putative N-acylglucosamine-6-phosphate 2-epimerase